MTPALDDPLLEERSPGQEFALAHAREGLAAEVRLRASITTMFPPAKQRPRLTVRDLIRVTVVDRDEILYPRETLAAEDPEAATALAPERRFRFSAERAVVGTVQASVRVPTELLGDPVALASFVDHRLIVRLCTAENEALLYGTGDRTGADGILGLLSTPGLRDEPPRAGVPESLLAALAGCEYHGGSADGIVMNPADWWPLLSAGGFLGQLAEAGVRINRTRMMPAGSALVGDFGAAATVLDRRTSTIRFAEPDPEAAQPTVLGEIREGLAVHLPGHFVRVRFPS